MSLTVVDDGLSVDTNVSSQNHLGFSTRNLSNYKVVIFFLQ